MNWILLLACSTTLVTCGCTSDSSHDSEIYMRLDAVGKGVISVPLKGHLAGPPVPTTEYRHYVQYGFTELDKSGPSLISSPAVYLGSSGAPVLIKGELVGAAVHGCVQYGMDGPIGYNPIAEIRSWTEIARRITTGVSSWPLVNGDQGVCVPGSLVIMATCWGDLNSGYTATTTLVDGNWVSLVGHAMEDFTGQRYAVLLDATPLAISTTRFAQEVLFSSGVPVGSMVFQCDFGAVGYLGHLPPHFRVDIAFAGGGKAQINKTVYYVVNEDLNLELRATIDALGCLVRDHSRILAAIMSDDRQYSWLEPDCASGDWETIWEGDEFSIALGVIFNKACAGQRYKIVVNPKEG